MSIQYEATQEPRPTYSGPFETAPEPTDAERQVADLMVIKADAASAKATLEDVPFWFHTFAIETDGDRSYTPGMARDHRYRLPALPEDYTGMNVLDIGAFDGFYAFLAESRGADYVLAVDNEQYRDWIASRWGAELEGGEGFAAIAGLLDSNVDYRTLDAFDLDEVEATFDLVLCFGILHRVENPLGLLRILARRTAEGGRVLLETHGSSDTDLDGLQAVHVPEPGGTYSNDDSVFWGFTPGSLDTLARHAGFGGFELIDAPTVDGHPRLIGALVSAETNT